MINRIIKLSNYLRANGLKKEANYIDAIIKLATPLGDISDVNEDMAKQMEELEEIYFGPHGRAESAEEIMDDLQHQEDVTGVVYTGDKPEDEGSVKGYLYGFRFDPWHHSIDWEDFECFVPECEDIEYFIEDMEEQEEKRNILYVSNLLVEKRYRHKVIEIIDGFLNKVRDSGYEYIVFDAMPRTFNLVMQDGRPNPERESKFGLKVLGKTDYNAFLIRVDHPQGRFSKRPMK